MRHTVFSQWGHDFRPDYSRLGEVRAELGNPLTIALTAICYKAGAAGYYQFARFLRH